jgi:hypothetical protein
MRGDGEIFCVPVAIPPVSPVTAGLSRPAILSLKLYYHISMLKELLGTILTNS